MNVHVKLFLTSSKWVLSVWQVLALKHTETLFKQVNFVQGCNWNNWNARTNMNLWTSVSRVLFWSSTHKTTKLWMSHRWSFLSESLQGKLRDVPSVRQAKCCQTWWAIKTLHPFELQIISYHTSFKNRLRSFTIRLLSARCSLAVVVISACLAGVISIWHCKHQFSGST